MPKSYNLSRIRTLLIEGYTDEEIRQLCFDTPDFRPVYDQLAQNSGKNEIIHRLVEYADRKELLDRLLSWAQKHNPNKYQRYSPYYEATDKRIENEYKPEIDQRTKKTILTSLPSLIIIAIVVFSISSVFVIFILRTTWGVSPSTNASLNTPQPTSNQGDPHLGPTLTPSSISEKDQECLSTIEMDLIQSLSECEYEIKWGNAKVVRVTDIEFPEDEPLYGGTKIVINNEDGVRYDGVLNFYNEISGEWEDQKGRSGTFELTFADRIEADGIYTVKGDDEIEYKFSLRMVDK